MNRWTPELQLHARSGICRLSLVGVTYGNGETLQEASNDLMARLFDLATAYRAGRYRLSSEFGTPQARVLEFLWEVGEIATRGGDIREHVLGIPAQRIPAE